MAMKERLPGGPRQTITSLAVLARNGFEQPNGAMWATPKANDADGRSGQPQRIGPRSNLTDYVEREEPKRSASLNPTWVEHMMAMPLYWTDPDFANELVVPVPWWFEPPNVPRTEKGVRHRADRLRAVGNGVVWPCAYFALERALAATPMAELRSAA